MCATIPQPAIYHRMLNHAAVQHGNTTAPHVRSLPKMRSACSQALDTCEALKEEERRRTAALEDAILGLRDAQSTRDMRRAESALRQPPRPQGPLQLTGALQLRTLRGSAAKHPAREAHVWGSAAGLRSNGFGRAWLRL